MNFFWTETGNGIGVGVFTFDGCQITLFEYRTMPGLLGGKVPVGYDGDKKFWNLENR